MNEHKHLYENHAQLDTYDSANIDADSINNYVDPLLRQKIKNFVQID